MEELSGCYNNVAVIYDQSGDYKNALTYYSLSFKANQKLGYDSWIAVSYNNLGTLHQEFGQLKKALKYFKLALELKLKSSSKISIARTYNNLGEVYLGLGKFKDAYEYFQNALKIKLKEGSLEDIASTYNNLGELYEKQNNLKQALEYYAKSVIIQDSINDHFGAAASFLDIGALKLKKSDADGAIYCLNKSVNQAEQVSAIKELSKAYLLLSRAYEKRYQTDQALKYFKLYNSTQNEIQVNENSKLLTQMELKHINEQKQQELEFLKKENSLQENSLVVRRSLNIFLGVSLVLAVLFLLMLGIYSNNRKKSNLILQSKYLNEVKQKEEKETLLKEVHHRVKNNLQIINSLLRLQSYQLEDNATKTLFTDCQNRVASMALIHEKLYRTDDLATINIEEYVNELTEGLLSSYAFHANVKIEVETSVKNLGINTIVPFGLILNEIISNSLKYGFRHMNEGVISLNLSKDNKGIYTLLIGDNGLGYDAEVFNKNERETLGIELIKTLTEQLDGEIELLDSPGTFYKLTFKDI